MNWFKSPLSYIYNRWVDPTHRITIKHKDCPPGQYRDRDTIMLYGMFQLLMDFVEVECAGHGYRSNTHHFQTPGQRFYKRISDAAFFRWFLPSGRNPLRGLHYIRWCINLKGPHHESQAKFGKDVFTLYKFWKHTRPRRIDPWEPYYLLREGKSWKGELSTKEKKLMKKCQKIEDKYEKQDEEMLKFLIKIRKGLWT